jgi:hypoxanthine phosphoribosyltransferase
MSLRELTDFEQEIVLKDNETIKSLGEHLEIEAAYRPYIERILISPEALKARIKYLAKDVARDYKGEEELICIVILNGAVMFFPSLALELYNHNGPRMVFDTMGVSSYIGTQSSGKLTITKDIMHEIAGRRVLIVEDILDTGRTMVKIKDYLLNKKKAVEVKICSLMDKPSQRKVNIRADFNGFSIPNEYVVGFGFDYDQYFRNLPFVGVLKQ